MKFFSNKKKYFIKFFNSHKIKTIFFDFSSSLLPSQSLQQGYFLQK